MSNVELKSILRIITVLSVLTGARPVPARSLLAPVIAALPDIPLVVRGEVQQRDARGRIATTYPVEMVLDWKAEIPTARYTIRDAFGAPLQHLAITWPGDAAPVYQYFEGSPLRSAPLPPLHTAIQGTDITWIDLSLSFLWWPGGIEQGEASVRGRDCTIVDVPAPQDQDRDVNGMRLWIDNHAGMVLRAESYRADGSLIRRMDIKSFKKINGRWVIKDLDFEGFPAKSRTSLRVRHVEERERFALPNRDDEAEIDLKEEPLDRVPEPQAVNEAVD